MIKVVHCLRHVFSYSKGSKGDRRKTGCRGESFNASNSLLVNVAASECAPESVHDMRKGVYGPVRSAESRIMALSPPGTLKHNSLAAVSALK